MSNSPEQVYREEADFLLRENINKLKGLIDLLCLGVTDEMDATEREEFYLKMKHNMDSLYQKLGSSISERT